jgi:aryl-alcohol dehydrogenase-like predicted oxidoreductase
MNLPFVLGAAQFGLKYGITNTSGCIKPNEIHDIVSCCLDEGIYSFDSALAYGKSLDMLAASIPAAIKKDIDIINKFSLKDDLKVVYAKLNNYLASSGFKKFYALLIHDPQEIHNIDTRQLLDFFYQIKSQNIVNKIGVSVYDIDQLGMILDKFPIDLVQCPINLFDQSFLSDKVIDAIKERNIELHARSLFLQGVLLANTLPKKLSGLGDLWGKYQLLLKELHMTPIEFIMSWARDKSLVDKWVVGVTSHNELKEILYNYKAAKALSKNHSYNNLSDPTNPLINPSNWRV